MVVCAIVALFEQVIYFWADLDYTGQGWIPCSNMPISLKWCISCGKVGIMAFDILDLTVAWQYLRYWLNQIFLCLPRQHVADIGIASPYTQSRHIGYSASLLVLVSTSLSYISTVQGVQASAIMSSTPKWANFDGKYVTKLVYWRQWCHSCVRLWFTMIISGDTYLAQAPWLDVEGMLPSP